MYIWQKSVSPNWLQNRGDRFVQQFGARLALVELSGQRRNLVEIACRTSRETRTLKRLFGGKVIRLRRDWLERYANEADAVSPLNVGSRLTIFRSRPRSNTPVAPKRSQAQSIVIPAEAAFGTGEHATTAMSLRLLERVTRQFESGWRMLDAGTGSGILAIAGARFGAGQVIAIDTDPLACQTARRNARFNGVSKISVVTADVLRKRFRGKFDVITANIFSEILIAAFPLWERHLAPEGFLILSGILRNQESAVVKALRQARFSPLKICRRGKWVTVLARRGAKKAVDVQNW